MIQRIISALNKSEVRPYIINEVKTETAELFFIKRKLDMRRVTDIVVYNVTVYQDFEVDGIKMRGSSIAKIHPGMTDDEIISAINDAKFSAGHVRNKFYALPDPIACDIINNDNGFGSPEETAVLMANALYKAEKDGDSAFVNSAEVFASNQAVRIISSEGTDVGYTHRSVNGEFVVQCKEPNDVEFYTDFSYLAPDTKALTELASQSLKYVKDRANAKKNTCSGEFDIILSDENLSQLLKYFITNSNAAFVYPGYSSYKVGESIQRIDGGEKLNITLMPTVPFSEDGIKMDKISLIKNGVLKQLYGTTRFCRYLNAEPTGNYSSFKVDNGTVTLDELKKKPCLHIVKFSDFSVDSILGDFGGEIRLAYLYDGEKVTAVTGGTISGRIEDINGKMTFSTDRYTTAYYDGPFAAKIPGVKCGG